MNHADMPTPPEQSSFNRCGSSGDLLIGLFHHAAPNLSQSDLLNVSRQAAELSETIARSAGAVAEGVMMSLSSPGSEDSAFQSEDHLSQLLCSFSEAFRHVAGLTFVSGEAAFMAQRRGAKR